MADLLISERSDVENEPQKAICLFISYSHKDEHLRNELETHLNLLQRTGLIAVWHDRKIEPGGDWKEQIDENVERADIILLLVSADFIASDYCYDKEMKLALKGHKARKTTVIPVIVRDVNWRRAPFAGLQALPKDGKAVMEWQSKDAAWRNVSEGIERVVENIRKVDQESQRLEKHRIDEERRRFEEEQQRVQTERKAEEERKRKAKEERGRKKTEEQERARKAEAKRKAEDERKRKEAEEEAERARKAEAERKAEEKRKFKAEEERRKAEERRRFKEEQKRAEAERKSEEESRRKAEENRNRREAEEAERKAEEDQHHWVQEEERKRKETEEQERARRAEIERKAEEERKRKAIPNSYRNIIGMEFVLIPAGSFTMGSSFFLDTESPAHKVKISQPFYLQTTVATQGQWNKVMKDEDNPPSFDKCRDDCPVKGVSWEDAQKFIEKLNQLEKTKGYRLPSEAEWEYACRAGTTTEYSFGDDASNLGEYAWYDKNSKWGRFLPIRRTHPVATKKPNPWSLYDMHGNVDEWVEDDWHNSYKGAPADGRAWVDKPRGSLRVIRGGDWEKDAVLCRSATRNFSGSAFRGFDVGFRLSRSIPITP